MAPCLRYFKQVLSPAFVNYSLFNLLFELCISRLAPVLLVTYFIVDFDNLVAWGCATAAPPGDQGTLQLLFYLF